MAELITEDYRAEQKRLHDVGNYGTAALKWGKYVSALIDRLQVVSVLDYGCGSKRSLLKVLESERDVFYRGYDPAIPEFAGKEPSDLVCCIDVLEHIEPHLLDNVLDDLAELSRPWAFLTIHTGPAAKILSDGRNAHLIQQPAEWWLPKLMQRWELHSFNRSENGFFVVCQSRHSAN